MVGGANGMLGPNVARLVAEEFLTEPEIVVIQFPNMVAPIAWDMQGNQESAIQNTAVVCIEYTVNLKNISPVAKHLLP